MIFNDGCNNEYSVTVTILRLLIGDKYFMRAVCDVFSKRFYDVVHDLYHLIYIFNSTSLKRAISLSPSLYLSISLYLLLSLSPSLTTIFNFVDDDAYI